MKRLCELPRVYSDTSMFCRIDEALGWTGLLACLTHFEDSLRIVTDVNRELRDHVKARRFLNLETLRTQPMTGEFLRDRAVLLAPEDAVRVHEIASGFPDADPLNARKNYGEVATILQAERETVPVIMDDPNGLALATDRGVVAHTTRDVAVEMFDSGAISEREALKLWDAVYAHDREEGFFDAALEQFRANQNLQ